MENHHNIDATDIEGDDPLRDDVQDDTGYAARDTSSPGPEPASSRFQQIWGKHGLVIAAGIAFIVLIVAIFGIRFVIKNGVTNTRNTKEAALNAQYVDNQNYLSDCVVRIRESAGVARGETAALDQVLTDAVKGRYDGTATGEAVDSGKLFSAVVEAYPDLSGLSDSFENVMSVVNGCRTDFRGQQTKLTDMLRSYDSWCTGTWKVRTFGECKSDNLKARIGTKTLSGEAAYDQMWVIVTVNGTDTAFETGELQPEDPFGTTPATTG